GVCEGGPGIAAPVVTPGGAAGRGWLRTGASDSLNRGPGAQPSVNLAQATAPAFSRERVTKNCPVKHARGKGCRPRGCTPDPGEEGIETRASGRVRQFNLHVAPRTPAKRGVKQGGPEGGQERRLGRAPRRTAERRVVRAGRRARE